MMIKIREGKLKNRSNQFDNVEECCDGGVESRDVGKPAQRARHSEILAYFHPFVLRG